MPGGLLTVTTQAVRSIREETHTHATEPIIRQVLNLRQLTQIVSLGSLQNDSEWSLKSGRKRSAPAAVPDSIKRARVDALSLDSCSRKESSTEEERKILVYTHRFELGYTTAFQDRAAGVANTQRRYADDERANALGWLQEEKQLVDALTQGETSNPRTFELGDVSLEDYFGVTQLYIGSRPCSNDHEHDYLRYLMILPTCEFPKHLQGDRASSVLGTCFWLKRMGLISMSASASLLYIPGIVAPELPIQLHVNVNVSLVVPAIFSPPSFQVPAAASIEGQRRRFLSYLFCEHAVRIDDCAQPRGLQEGQKDPRHFYSILDAAPPISSSIILDALQPQGLHATLLPFQRRTVKWLLEREHKTLDSNGRIVPYAENPKALPLFWQRVCVPVATMESSLHKSTWYYNRLTGSLCERFPPSINIAGAMLCEEMGLGKTLECIALMLLNPATDRNPSTTRWDLQTELEVSPVKTNLIVTPTTLLQQWLDELARHAPGLRVLSYTGYNKFDPSKGNPADCGEIAGQSTTHRLWCSCFQAFDVVVTTYNVLSQELCVAKAPIIRPKRQLASYSHVEKPRSPLVRVEWARVFMDEVQLVGGGKTAEMVSLIPRDVSIAVSGTPTKSKVSDLFHVLKFLRVEEAIGSTKTWDSLLKPEFNDLFSDLFKKYAVRTLKSRVKGELIIPSQKRYAVGIEFGKAERHIYDLTLQEALEELGVDDRGVTDAKDWQLDISLLRSWLRRLRQVCTHPQVGIARGNKAAVRAIGTKTIQTIEEVLQSYQEQNWNSLVTEAKNRIQIRTRRAQLIQLVDDDLERYQRAKLLLQSAQLEVEQLLDEVKGTIAAHEDRGKEIIEETAARRGERRHLDVALNSQVSSSKGKGKVQDLDFEEEPNDSDHDGLPRTQLGDGHRFRSRNLQGRLRDVYVLQHKVLFLLGDVYHMLGISIQEDAMYAAAEVVRKTVLKSSEESAISAMRKLPPIARDGLKRELRLSFCQKGGIRTSYLMDEANEVLDLLNEQGELLWQWRARIFTLLTERLSSEEGDKPDGEEYARTLDTQREAEAYIEAYAALLADRKEALNAERTALAEHDGRESKFRGNMAERVTNHLMSVDEDIEMEPEDQILRLELAEERKRLKDDRSQRALKAIMFQLNEIGNRSGDRFEENHIAKSEGNRLRKIIANQGALMEKLELELASFRKAFNERIQYFRQLQEISDSVVQPEFKGDIREAIELSKADEEKVTLQVNSRRAGQRHFLSLAKDRAEGDLEEEDCVLCGDPFQRGLMTPCGHIFCEGCLTRWLKHRGKKSHLDCPMCRSNVEIEALQRISLNDADYEKQLNKRGEPKVDPSSLVKFNTLPQSVLDEIETFEVLGSYGSKITHLIRHLRFLQNQEPGTKSVVFSAWSDSLTIIQMALTDNGINCIRVDQKGNRKQDAAQKFRKDPTLQVFLLHGERENAGLNLTCAKRVWLIEPTVNQAFEVQAISRVDRMGQTSATEVFCYFIQDTVEENILRMGAKHGHSLYTEDHARDTIDISEFAMGIQKVAVDSPSKKGSQKGDFIAQAEDLIHVLFPHLDFQEEDIANLNDVASADQRDHGTNKLRHTHVNAVAGPSRLH